MNRRTLLASGAAAVTYSVAGCIGGDGGDPIAFDTWLPAPAIFDRDDYPSPFQYYDAQSLVDEEDNLGDFFERYGFLQTDPILHHAGLELSAMDLRVASPALYSAVEGDFELSDVQDAIDGDERYTEDSTQGDWVIYQVEGLLSNQGAFGVMDGAAVRVGETDSQDEENFIIAPSTRDQLATLTSVLDANDDESQRYTQNEYVATLVDELGMGDTGFGVRRRSDETSIPNSVFRGQEAWGAEFDVDGGTTQFTEVYVFAEGQNPPESDLEDWVSRDTPHEWGSNTQPSDTSIEIEENVAVITGEFDTADGFEIL